MGHSLLGALPLEKIDNGRQCKVAIGAVDKGHEDMFDGPSRFAVNVKRICFENELEKEFEVRVCEYWALSLDHEWFATSCWVETSGPHRRRVTCVASPRAL